MSRRNKLEKLHEGENWEGLLILKFRQFRNFRKFIWDSERAVSSGIDRTQKEDHRVRL